MPETTDTIVKGGFAGVVLGYLGLLSPQRAHAEAIFENGARYPWIKLSKPTFIKVHGAVSGGALFGMSLAAYQLAYRTFADMQGDENAYSNSLGAACATFASIGMLYPGSRLFRMQAAISGTAFSATVLELQRRRLHKADDPNPTMH